MIPKPLACLALFVLIASGGCAAVESLCMGGVVGSDGPDYVLSGTRAMMEPHGRFFAKLSGNSFQALGEAPLSFPIALPVLAVEVPGTLAIDTALLPITLSHKVIRGIGPMLEPAARRVVEGRGGPGR